MMIEYFDFKVFMGNRWKDDGSRHMRWTIGTNKYDVSEVLCLEQWFPPSDTQSILDLMFDRALCALKEEIKKKESQPRINPDNPGKVILAGDLELKTEEKK